MDLHVENKEKLSSNDESVQASNDWSIVSKYSAAHHGYYDDPSLKYFVAKLSRRSPILHRGYWVRAQAVDYVIKWFQSIVEKRDIKDSQILILGAGFNTIPQKYKHTKIRFFEVDLPSVVSRKIAILKEKWNILFPGTDYVSDSDKELRSSHFTIICSDLRKTGELQATLERLGLRKDVPTLIVSEVVLAYLHEKESTDVVNWTGSYFTNAAFFIYEQICPEDPFGQIMCSHFIAQNAALLTIQKRPHVEDHRKRFLSAGWDKAVCATTEEFYWDCIDASEKERISKLEPFDEHEVWIDLLKHYIIAIGLKGEMSLKPGDLGFCERDIYKDSPVLGTSVKPCKIRRYNFSSAIVSDQVLVIGGFGSKGKQHGRCGDVVSWSRSTNNVTEVALNFDPKLVACVGHTSFAFEASNGQARIIVFGGRSSPLKPIQGTRVLFYDSSKNTMTLERTILVEPEARWRHGMCADASRNLLYISGGLVQDKVFDDVWQLSVDDFRWQKVHRSPALERFSHSMTYWEGKLVIAGGMNSSAELLGDVLLLDLFTKNVEILTHISPIFGHKSLIHDDFLYIIGGIVKNSDFRGVFSINLQTGVIREVRIQEIMTSIFLTYGFEVVEEDCGFLLFGGGGHCFSFGTHFNNNSVFVSKNLLNS
ncbi:tRNA wybutosine-synthesizing protein 4-like isoform X2 [Artemia franciscana]|uniref:tRNA wybutosine-synthesizing protein 4-like isoform X2 n=1 Tax=Artemia franciscana TaxID=6661 RepID=UPI0032DBC596